MANPITIQELVNASLDAQTLGTFVNGDENAVNHPRLRQDLDVGSLAELRKKIFLQLAAGASGHKGFKTLADAQAAQASLPANTLVEVTNDSDSAKNGVYLWDGATLTKSLYDPAAVAKNYTDNLETSRQLTSSTDFTVDGYYINKSTGLAVAEPTYQSTDFIQVEPNVTYSYSLLLATIPGGVFYDENKLYISGFGTPQNTSQFTVVTPANARYVRLSNTKSYATPYFKADGRYNIAKLLNVTNAFKPVNNLARQTFLSDAFSIADSFVNINGFGNFEAATDYSRTDYIAVEPNISYELLAQTAGNAGQAWYDADKKFISGLQANTVTTVIAPSNARYIALSVLKTNLSSAYFKTVDERLSISKVTNIVNAFPPTNTLAQQPITTDKYTVVNSFVNYGNGNFERSEQYNRTDFIKVEPNVSYEVSAQGFLNAGAAWFDKDKKYISGFSNEAQVSVVSPANAMYVVVSSQKTKLQTAYLKATNERLNIDKVTNIINAYVPTRPMLTENVVKSKTELLAVNKNGDSDRAYPIGRRVYDQSLRSEVYADGSFWRLPDGTPANLAPRTYVFPDWDEIRAALPTYATAYKKITDANSLSGWAKTQNSAALNFSLSTEHGFNSICMEKSDDSDAFVYFNNGSPIGLNTYLIFKIVGDFSTMQYLQVALFDSDGNKLFYKFLTSDVFGENGRNIYNGLDVVKVELRANEMASAFNGASLDNVAGIGFAASRKADTIKLWVGAIETVSFKPMITLRFDDQRLSVYQNAYPVMDKYGFKGMIAVITGRPNLGNDPDINYGSINADGMTKDQLIEVKNKGWDLVSHTHTHPEYWNKTDEYMRADYRKSVDYLRKELGVSELASSILVSPFGNRDERIAQIQRKYFDAQINQVGNNSHMPRQPEGTWDKGSLWTDLRSHIGDGNNADTLISYAQQAIAKQRWVSVMMHDILPIPANSTNINVNDFVTFMDWLNANRNLIDVITITDVVKKIRPNG